MRPKANPVGNPREAKSVEPAASLTVEEWVEPAPPSNLGPIGQHIWSSVWSAGRNVYHTQTDCFVIERYCKLQERRLSLEARIEDEGWTVVGSQGQDVLNPLARVVQDAESKLTALEDRLGLNAEARIRLGIAAVEHKSAIDALRDSL